MLRAYLVDDELPALKRLTRLLEATGRVEIVGSATNPTEALDWLSNHQPDVLFLDIQMPGMNGFDLLARLKLQPVVVFTTAYDQYALRAFEVNSIDYLLKPVEPEQLERALGKLEQFSLANRPEWLSRPELRTSCPTVSPMTCSNARYANDRSRPAAMSWACWRSEAAARPRSARSRATGSRNGSSTLDPEPGHGPAAPGRLRAPDRARRLHHA